MEHEAIGTTMRKCKINASILQAIEIYTTMPEVQFCSKELLEPGSELNYNRGSSRMLTVMYVSERLKECVWY